MNREKIPFYIAIGTIAALILIIPFACQSSMKRQAKCESLGGKYVTGKGVSICLDKKSVIELD